MLKSEESDKRKLAFELHEGLAQTLAALKLKVENGRTRRPGETAGGESADGIIPVLQEAIKEVRTIATDLRPPSLDDLGLLPTLTWLCREFEDQHPGLSIERQIVVQENDVPNTLKAILYRIVASVLDDMAKRAGVGRIHLALWRDDGNLMLLIDDAATGTLDSTATPLAKIDPELRAGFARMEELTTLSGGTFTASHHSAGNTTLRATWKC
jgi:signal transduction histidine kinase